MKIIKALSEKINEEIADAKSYAQMALAHKDDYPDLSRTLYTIATQEMDHMKMLHDKVSDIISDYRKDHGEPPAPMLAVYNYLHEKSIEDSAEVKTMLTMYKES